MLFLFAWWGLQAQSPHPIGFADTLLFNDGLHYSAFGYEGPAPLFVQVWFPLGGTIAEPVGRLDPINLRFRDLRKPSLPLALQRVYSELLLRMDSAFIEYCLREPVDDDEPIDYAPFTEQQVKDSLLALPTRAHRASLPLDGDRPVIVYHHGSQGLSDENVWMAEYFAEHGFVFLSANFHWPLEAAMYGTPLVWHPDRHSIRSMLRFARQLANGNKVFYIGHSWGAQEGWCTLHEPGLADAFISLETTMEWKTDTAEVRDKWPHVLEAITTHSYPMPILMVADTEGEPPFPMFKGVRGDPAMAGQVIRYLDHREPFAHESYTSAYLMRMLGVGRFNVPDAEILFGQLAIYEAMLSEILDFLTEQLGEPRKQALDPTFDLFHRFPSALAPTPSGR